MSTLEKEERENKEMYFAAIYTNFCCDASKSDDDEFKSVMDRDVWAFANFIKLFVKMQTAHHAETKYVLQNIPPNTISTYKAARSVRSLSENNMVEWQRTMTTSQMIMVKSIMMKAQ